MPENRFRKYLLYTLILFQIFPLSGCYDSKELDEKTFLTMIGIDKGTYHSLKLSLQFERFSDSSKSTSGKTGISTNIEVVSEEVDSLYTGEGLLTIATSREYENSHVKMVIFSEELARSKGFEKLIASTCRTHSIRGITHIIIAKGTAEDFLKENQLMTNASTSKAIEILMKQIEYNAYFPHIKLNEFYIRMKSSRRQAIVPLGGVNKKVSDSEREKEKEGKIKEDKSKEDKSKEDKSKEDKSKEVLDDEGNIKNAEKQSQNQATKNHMADDSQYKVGELPRAGGLAREIFGSAVFDGAKMVGELTGEETRLLLMVRGEFKKSDFAIQDPTKKNDLVIMTVQTSREPEISVDIGDVRPLIHVKISLDGKIDAIESGIDYERPELKKLVEKAFEDENKRQLDKLILKCQKEFKSDVFGFGRAAIIHFLTIEEWEKYNWLNTFTKAQVITEIGFNIRRTGTLMKSEDFRNFEGRKKSE